MITGDCNAFVDFVRGLAPDFGPPTARAAFLVAPDGFGLASQSATDNRYMATAGGFDAARAWHEHHELQRAMSPLLPTVCFAGDPRTPEAVFPNNVFATAGGRYLVGRMRHPQRRLEARRADIRGFFRNVLGYSEVDLSTQPHACELTGALVIDRARGVGFCGLSERCDEVGARLMHAAFGLRASLLFELAAGEYHTNVVLALLAGRAALICPQGFAEQAVVGALTALYAPHALLLSPAEHAGYAANAIALSDNQVWMSAAAAATLTAASHSGLAAAGFQVRTAALEGIEAGGGSLRCCIGEIF